MSVKAPMFRKPNTKKPLLTSVVGGSSRSGERDVAASIFPRRPGRTTCTQHLQRTGTVQTWTTLSAAGAPSEFSLRAPLLGGISTVLLNLDDGPNGVFLTVDDEDAVLEMDARMNSSYAVCMPKKAHSIRPESTHHS